MMEDLLKQLNESSHLKSTLIQELMIYAKKHNETSEASIGFWKEVTKLLWTHLKNTLKIYDDQLLGATCFFTVLPKIEEIDLYLKKIYDILQSELEIEGEAHKETNRTLQAVSLMYGMYQSSFLTKNKDVNELLILLLCSTFKLLLKFCYKYSRYTFIAFKTLSSLKKICNTNLEEIVLTEENKIKLLNMINHNWENPISGVRDLNRDIFLIVTPTLNEEMYKTVFEEINTFYWNKAKYLMLSIIIEKPKENVVELVDKNNWVDGLIYSLHKQGLVSAGADMYFAIFKNLKIVEEWTKLFEKDIVNILKGSSSKAIENFTNYWCLTSLKKFPSILDILIERLQVEESQNQLLSTLCLFKQANKLGLIKKDWNLCDCKQTAILKGLSHSNSYIRMLSFDIVCVRQSKTMPEEIEYKIVLDFLHNNINSDCTVLRLNTLNSFNTFLSDIHIIYLNNVKDDEDIKNFETFCKKFQELIIYCLNLNGNYQRKVSSIKLVKIFFSSLSEVPRKRQKQTKQSNFSLLEVLKKNTKIDLMEENFFNTLIDLLNDPADDIRDNVTDLLFNHYVSQLREPRVMEVLIERALRNIQSKFFYEISCGQSMFKLITNTMIKENQIDAAFKTVEDVFNYAVTELVNESKLNRSVVESIEKGKQLHSFMSIIQVVIEVSKRNNYNLQISNEDTSALLGVLCATSNQFLHNEEVSTSSDFSKMSDMVENMIKTSGYDSVTNTDSTKISGLHQIVLNCLWLNVKASCDLSTLLIENQTQDDEAETCEKFLKIIIHVLETCRHKGAIEAAGVSLSQSIKYLTSLPEDSKLSKLPYILLKNKLQELILEGSKMASITRRGAGLSIMVHRIVSSDTNKSKPLFHYFMKTLLETCNRTADIPEELTQNGADNEKDLPKAIYIHFLTKIVTDSSLASDMMYYSSQLAALAFGNLTSPHWQIRNAALQLYGALIPKLIGQKKPSGTDDETISTVSIDELRTHSPELWQFIQNQILKTDFKDKIQHDSNMVPILNMLANIARRYNFSLYTTENGPSDALLLEGLFSLLNSPIMTVRRLTGKAIHHIYSFEMIYERLCGLEIHSENLLHGCLGLIQNYHKQYSSDQMYVQHFKILHRNFNEIINTRRHSYSCKELFESIYMPELNLDVLKQTMSEVRKYSYEPGIHLWAKQRFRVFIDKVNWIQIPETLRLILNSNKYESYCTILSAKIETESLIPDEILEELIDILLKFKSKFISSIVWKILYQVSKKLEQPKIKNGDMIFEIVEYIKSNKVSYKLRYIIPFLTRMMDVKDSDHITKIILSLTDAETTDVEMRLIAAMANNELVFRFFDLSLKTKITALKSALILLQDEDEDIRHEAIKFYKGLTKTEAPHPYICLINTISRDFLLPTLGEDGIVAFCQEFDEMISKYSNHTVEDTYNPFASDSKNIYLEVSVYRQLVNKIKK